MLLVLFNSIVIGLIIVSIIQAYEIRSLKKDVLHIKFVQVAAVLNDEKHPLKKLMKDVEERLKEGEKDESKSEV